MHLCVASFCCTLCLVFVSSSPNISKHCGLEWPQLNTGKWILLGHLHEQHSVTVKTMATARWRFNSLCIYFSEFYLHGDKVLWHEKQQITLSKLFMKILVIFEALLIKSCLTAVLPVIYFTTKLSFFKHLNHFELYA